MRCPQCQHETSEPAKFCEECGTKLVQTCPIDPALQLMMEAVHRYEGYVAQSLGDGIFALFGAPLAHEDHPQRALYAALRMQEENKRYAEKLRLEKGVNLQHRVGVNTGEVVVRSIRKDDLHTDYVPVGHSTSLAARMQNLATPGSILVTEHTYKLTEGYFECKPLGAAQMYRLKGELFRQKPVPSTSSGQALSFVEGAKIEAEAEACFRQAIDIARRQQAKSLELRAVISLSRLWQKQGKTEEARPMLAEIYSWFTEGFETGDLKEAKALLEELS